MMDLQENFPYFIRISHHGQTSQMGIAIRAMEDNLINAKISPSVEMMEIDLEMHPSLIRLETGETMETFLVLRRVQGETSIKINLIANQEMINPTTLPSADPTAEQLLVLLLTNRSSHKAIIRHHLMWFASPQPPILFMKFQSFVR